MRKIPFVILALVAVGAATQDSKSTGNFGSPSRAKVAFRKEFGLSMCEYRKEGK